MHDQGNLLVGAGRRRFRWLGRRAPGRGAAPYPDCEAPIPFFYAFGLSLRDWEVRPTLNLSATQPNELPQQCPTHLRPSTGTGSRRGGKVHVALAIVEQVRRRLTQPRIARSLGIPESTVSRTVGLAGLSKRAALQPSEPVARYEHAAQGAWSTSTPRHWAASFAPGIASPATARTGGQRVPAGSVTHVSGMNRCPCNRNTP
jgi:hypothetical protein